MGETTKYKLKRLLFKLKLQAPILTPAIKYI